MIMADTTGDCHLGRTRLGGNKCWVKVTAFTGIEALKQGCVGDIRLCKSHADARKRSASIHCAFPTGSARGPNGAGLCGGSLSPIARRHVGMLSCLQVENISGVLCRQHHYAWDRTRSIVQHPKYEPPKQGGPHKVSICPLPQKNSQREINDLFAGAHCDFTVARSQD